MVWNRTLGPTDIAGLLPPSGIPPTQPTSPTGGSGTQGSGGTRTTTTGGSGQRERNRNAENKSKDPAPSDLRREALQLRTSPSTRAAT